MMIQVNQIVTIRMKIGRTATKHRKHTQCFIDEGILDHESNSSHETRRDGT